jgi:hypothetical protein
MNGSSNGAGSMTLDNVEYALADLSPDALAQLASAQACDRRIANLQEELAILQTARIAYVNAMKDLLPTK